MVFWKRMVRNNYSSLQLRHEVKRCISQLQKRYCYGFHSTPGVAPSKPGSFQPIQIPYSQFEWVVWLEPQDVPTSLLSVAFGGPPQETSWPGCNPGTYTRTGLPLGLPFNVLHFTNNYVPGDVLGTDGTKIGNEQNLSKSQCPAYKSQACWLVLKCEGSPSKTGRVFAVKVTQMEHRWLPAQYLGIPSGLPVSFLHGAAQYWPQYPGGVCSSQNRARPLLSLI